MTRIRCWEYTCVYNKRGICSAQEMEYHPDRGCLTYEEREGDEEEEQEEEIEEEEEEEDESEYDDNGWGD